MPCDLTLEFLLWLEFFFFFLKVALLNLITISSTWARVIDVMDCEVSMLQRGDLKIIMVLYSAFDISVVFSQVQDCLGSLVLVLHLVSYLDRCLLHQWLGWVLVCMLRKMRLFNVWVSVCLNLVLNDWLVQCNCSFTSICCFVDGTSCTVIKRDQQGCIPSSSWIISHKVSH